MQNGEVVAGAWREGRQMGDCQSATGNNRDLRAGKNQRRLLTHWLNSKVGSIPWQRKRAHLPELPDPAEPAEDGAAPAAPPAAAPQ